MIRRWRDAATCAVLALVVILSVARAQRQVGVARDEVVYMGAGAHYADWWAGLFSGDFSRLSARGITKGFGGPQPTSNNREHPPLLKTLFGFSERILHRGLGLTGKITGYRLPSAIFFAALVVMVFLFGASVWGYGVGLAAALLAFLLPRQFFHAGLATFDGAVATTWMATVFAYYRALESRRWCVILGVVYGLALATKHNAIILPVPLLCHYVVVAYRGARAGRMKGPVGFFDALFRGVTRHQPLIFAALFAIGPLVLFILWPWLWIAPFSHVAEWIGFHLHHVHYNYEYLGRNWNHPPYPWHVPIVTTLLTVPVVTLVAGAIGAVELVRRARRGEAAEPDRAPALLLFLSAGAAMGPFILRSQPIFGAEKHWAAAIPTICIYAGVGLAAAARLLGGRLAALGARRGEPGRRRLETGALAALISVAACAALVETIDAQPYALTHYNALAGGAPGGADLGMNRQFWGVAARGVLPFINRYAPKKGEAPRRVYSHDAQPAWHLYGDVGLLAPGLPDAGKEEAGVARSKIAIVIHELHFNRHDYMIWRSYGTVQPAYVLTTDGVPIVSVYVRPDLDK